MKSLKEMCDWLLLEGKIDNLKMQYPDVADKIGFFANINPKYLSWIAKQLKPETSPEELEQMKDVLLKFTKASAMGLIKKKS